MNVLLGILAGALFAVGLTLGGMTDAHNVIAFLDVTGDWDPALMMVMVGGIATYGVLFRLSQRRAKPIFVQEFSRPTTTDLTSRLVIGAALFGIGWGLAGLCPGPAIASTATHSDLLAFVGAMFGGIATAKAIDYFLNRSVQAD